MAQPAPLPEEDNVPGNADSAPPGREHLKVLEGGGDTTEPDRSWYKPEGSQNAKNQDELADAESSASQTSAENTHENQVGSGYNPYGKLNKNNKRSARKWRFTKRRALFGGGLIGTIVAMFLFFVGSGPLQFVHIAQLLEQFHFSAQEDQSDDRFVKLARYIKYAPKGEAERTRLGVFQNKIADKIEARMNKVGIQSSYSDTFGFGDGYVINPDKLSTSDFENLKGKSDTEIKKYFRDNFNVEVKTMLPNGQKVPKGSFFVDSTNMGYFENRRFIQAMLKTSKYSRISSSVGARIMGKRAGVTWHPIKKLDNKILKTAEARYTQWKKNQITEIEKGANADLAAKSQPGDEKTKGEADSAASEGNSVASDGEDTGNKVNSGDTNAIADFQDRLSVKVTLGGAAAAGVLCMAKGIDQNAASIKQSQVVLPLIRQGMQAITLGNQVMSLQDVDREQLGFFAKQLDGKDSRGDKTSWIQAQSIQAELGNKPSGNIGKPNETLTTITKGSPFQSLNEGTVGTILGPVCSAPGGVVLTIVSFFGGPVSALAGTVVSSIASGPIMNTMAHWLAGKAVDPLPVGADLGNAINFGARLAANAQAVSAGGRELSDQESTQLASIQSQWSRQDFQDHSLAYQLFNPYDQRSAISKVIDRQSSDINQDFSHMASFLTNFKNTFSSLASIFTPRVSAATAVPYNYGFPKVGFSTDEMNSPLVKNPYKNAEDVVSDILPAHHDDYIERAKKCFGVTIDPTTYDITSFQAGDPQYKDIDSGDCKDNSTDWMKVRFYIFDTQTMESVACYEGEDDACSDVGFDESQSSDSTNDPTSVSGNTQQLAQQILNSSRISISCRHCQEDIQNTAQGKPAYGSVNLDVGILKFLLDLANHGDVTVTSITGAGTGHSSGSNHYTGHAIDLGCSGVGLQIDLLNQTAAKYNGKNNGERCDAPNPYGFAPHDHYDFSN